MKKLPPLFLCVVLLFILSACSSSSRLHTESINADQTEQTIPVTEAPPPPSEETASDTKEPPIKELQIWVEGEDGQNIVFQLNNSSAAHALYDQLPLSVPAEDYSNDEKIFYPPNELDTRDTPLAKGPAGTLAYYEPWGNVVLYYGECGGASGLYALGEAVSGTEQIETLSGELKIEAVNGE